MDYVNSHTPEEIAQVIKPQFKENDLETITKIVERYQQQDTWKEDTVFKEESFTLLQDILKKSKVLEQTVPYDDLVTTKYSEEALEKTVE